MEAAIRASGTHGIYVEPRAEDVREASPDFQVIWLPKHKKEEATLLSKQIVEVLGLALKEFGWNAKPVQVVQSGFSVQGLHWSVQATEDPPSTVLHFRASEAIITSVSHDPAHVRQGFKSSSATSSSVVVKHVKTEVLAQIPAAASTAPAADVDMTGANTEARIVALEKKMADLASAQDQLQASTAKQAAATIRQLTTLNSKVDEQKGELKAMFDQQMNQIEQLLSKRARTD